MNINLFNLMLSGLNIQQKVGWGLNGLVIGLGSVFVILVILIAVINLLKLSSGSAGKGRKVKETVVSSEQAAKTVADVAEDENEIIAAITAAINCMAQREGKRFAIKSYKRTGARTNRSY